MKPAGFEYHVPGTVDEAVGLVAELGEETKVLAGGQSLIPMLNLRLAVFEHLVDIGRVPELRGIEPASDSVWLGAATTQAAIERSAEVAKAVPLLARATPLIGHFQIRNRGTIGGSLAHADAAAEYPAVALTLDADFHVASPRGTRTISAADFFRGLWTTALEPDEVLTGLTFPVSNGRRGYAVEEFARRHGDFAVAGSTVAVELDADDRVTHCAVGLFGLGPTAERAPTVEAGLVGTRASDVDAAAAGHAATEALDSVPSDLHGSAAYRKRVGAEMVARAVREAVREASNG